MPLAIPILQFGLGIFALGTGVKFIGDGLSDTADGVTKVATVVGIGYAGFVIAKKTGVLK